MGCHWLRVDWRGLTAFSGSSGWGRMNEASGLGMAGSLRVVARPNVQPARTPEEGGEAARMPPRHFRSWTGPGPWGESRRVGRTWDLVGGLGARLRAAWRRRDKQGRREMEGAGLNLKSSRPKVSGELTRMARGRARETGQQ